MELRYLGGSFKETVHDGIEFVPHAFPPVAILITVGVVGFIVALNPGGCGHNPEPVQPTPPGGGEPPCNGGGGGIVNPIQP